MQKLAGAGQSQAGTSVNGLKDSRSADKQSKLHPRLRAGATRPVEKEEPTGSASAAVKSQVCKGYKAGCQCGQF